MPKRYYNPSEGEWFAPRKTDYRLACCDCGLVHRVDHKIKNGKILWRFFHARASTSAVRRKKQRFVKATSHKDGR